MIREYRDTDIDQLLEVWLKATRVAHPFLSEEFVETEREKIRTTHMPMADTWVWEEDSRVAGFIALLGSEVGAIFVLPDLHGRGIGRALMDHARDLHGTLELDVFESNPIGRAFYERYGFEVVGELTHEATGERCLRMRYPA